MLLEEISALGGNLKYYGGYASPPSSYPPPTADYDAITENTDSTKYIYTQGMTIYNSAILIYNNKTYISVLFAGACNIRGYYNNSAWTNVQAATLLGTCYSIANWSLISVGGVNVPCVSGLMDADSFISTDLPSFTNPQDYVEYITNLAQSYTWSSVPAISGKNGILTLSTLKSGSINNGNPVSDATLNAFEILIEASNVGKLVLDTDIDESQVVIRYNIPNNTYQYVKLVYKENYAPENISDGVAIDIQQTDTQLVLDDITTTGTYYFKIFTDNGNSNTVVLNYVGIIPIIIKIERVW